MISGADAPLDAQTLLPRTDAPRRRLAEFLLVGGSTPLLFALAYALRAALGLDEAEFWTGGLFFYGAWLINDPHFAVTYLLFYRDFTARAFGPTFAPAQRLRYLAAGVLVPLLLLGWALAALMSRSTHGLGALFQLMFLLVGWHYVKQNFGVLSVLCAQRGVRLSTRERRVFLAHCYAAWAYAWASPADLGTRTEQKGFVYTTFAHPHGLELACQLAFFATALPMLWVCARTLRRPHGRALLAPLFAFVCGVWTWTVYSSLDPLVRYAIPALHSVQYLYMVYLLHGNEAREREGPPWFESSLGTRLVMLALTAVLLGALLFHGGPAALDDLLANQGTQRALGPTPWFAALFAFVNLHHYFMDAVIWRRDNPLTRYLAR